MAAPPAALAGCADRPGNEAHRPGVTSAPVPFTKQRVLKAFADWRVWAYAVLYISIAVRRRSSSRRLNPTDALLRGRASLAVSSDADGAASFCQALSRAWATCVPKQAFWLTLADQHPGLAVQRAALRRRLCDHPDHGLDQRPHLDPRAHHRRLDDHRPHRLRCEYQWRQEQPDALRHDLCVASGRARTDGAVLIAGGVSPSIATAIACALSFGCVRR